MREALLHDPGAGARKRVLALILHERVRADALSVRHDANSTTVHAGNAEGFTSAALEALRQRRAEVDPFRENIPPEDHEAYARLRDVPDAQLDALIDLLTVECIAAHLHRRTELVAELATLFTDAAEGRLDDPRLAERVNAWLPVNLRRGGDEAEADA